MAIGSYPRVTVQGTGATNNIQNGLGLMVLNPSTSKYEAATAATFSGGGGGGDATAANQDTQIDAAIETNGFLQAIQDYLIYDGNPIATLLYSTTAAQSAASLLNDIKNLLTDIKTAQTSSVQKTQIVDASGNAVNVTSNKLNVDTA